LFSSSPKHVIFFFVTAQTEVGIEGPLTVRAIMCQPEACSTLAAAATLLIEEGILVVNCHTGFHRAESCAAVIAASLSKSGQYTVLHLSLCRDKISDLHHSVGVAIKWMASPWCESMHTSAPWDGLQQACLTRPEAWQCWADFQQWVACTAEADAKSWAACAAAANATSSSSGSLATTPKAAAKPSMKKNPETPKTKAKPNVPEPPNPKSPEQPPEPPTELQRDLADEQMQICDQGWDRDWEEPESREERSLPRTWYEVLQANNVDGAATLQLELLAEFSWETASEIIWKLSKQREEKIHNGSGFVNRCVTTARKDLHGAARGASRSWKW
jgi:hypothetical protein